VRYRLMAMYEGSPFEAGIGPVRDDIVLFAACPPPEELRFEPATGHWRKQLQVTDVQAVWESRPVGVFRGERCMVLDDLGDRLHIGYLGHDGFNAEKLGYWQVDRGVFELVAPRSEVSNIAEERFEYPRPLAASPPATGPQPAISADGSGSAGSSQRPADRDSAPRGQVPAGARQDPVPGSYSPGSTAQHTIPAAYMSVADSGTGVALPVAAPPPLPLEAQALRAASEARRPRPAAAARQRPSGRARLATEGIFADLADLTARAGIPAESYAIGEVIDGALCLVPAGQGFEVFRAAAGDRRDRQIFPTEEAACFYLFGVLAADAVRTGSLTRAPAGLGAG
jgi:hypothetical protein